jgi:hypothetical protein
MYHYSFREFSVVLIAVTAAFATGFLPVRQFGFLGYFWIVGSVLLVICFIAVLSIKRLAITIGLLITLAASLSVVVSSPPEIRSLRYFLFLLGMLGLMPMLIAIPLTIHRRAGRTRL